MFKDTQMDNMLNDVVSIFHLNEQADANNDHPDFRVKLVRLSGLVRRATRISGHNIDPETMDRILQKMKMQKIIDWKYAYQCPYCYEVIYQIENLPSDKMRLCESCNTMLVPSQHLHNPQIIL